MSQGRVFQVFLGLSIPMALGWLVMRGTSTTGAKWKEKQASLDPSDTREARKRNAELFRQMGVDKHFEKRDAQQKEAQKRTK